MEGPGIIRERSRSDEAIGFYSGELEMTSADSQVRLGFFELIVLEHLRSSHINV